MNRPSHTRQLSTGFRMLPAEDRAPVLFWIGLAIALGAVVNFCALAAAAN